MREWTFSYLGWRVSHKEGAPVSEPCVIFTSTKYLEMDKFGPSGDSSCSATSGNGRFASQAATAEDLLKAQTVGLVNLNEYRKRRAEAIELKERGGSAVSSGANTPLEGYSSFDYYIKA